MKFLRQETHWRIEENSNTVFAIITAPYVTMGITR